MISSRLKLWTPAAITVVVAAIVNYLIEIALGIDPFSITMWMVVPVGAVVICFAALSGFVLAHRTFKIEVRPIDLVFLMACALALPLLIYAIEYTVTRVGSGARFSEITTFQHFVFERITAVRMSVSSRNFGTSVPAPVGEFGWFMLLPRLAALLAIAKVVHSSCGGGARGYGQREWSVR